MAMLMFFLVLPGVSVCEASVPGIVSMSGTYDHVFAVLSDGSVWWWGDNSPLPKQIAGLTDVKQVDMWTGGCVALKNDGTVWTGYFDGSPPACLTQLGDVRQISDGSLLKNDGTVWVWHRYQNVGTPFSKPVQVPGLTDMVFIDHCVGVRSDGTVWEWGVTMDSSGLRTGSDDVTPVQVPVTDVKTVLCGETFGAVLKNDGTVWSWGQNSMAQLGNGKRDTEYYPTPARVDGLSDIVAISCGDFYTLAIKKDGSLWGWGNDKQLELGIVPVCYVTRPAHLTLISDIDRLYTVGATSFVVKIDGSLWSWGQNCLGQLGDGTINDPMTFDPKNHGKETPVRVLLDTGTVDDPTVTPAATPGATPTTAPSITPVPTDTHVSPTVTARPSSTYQPGASLIPSATPTMVPLPDTSSMPTPGFGFGTFGLLCSVLFIAGVASVLTGNKKR
ncbi:MAG: hypothetical protein WBZ29_09285 [Methanocella sp.]